MRFNKLDLNLLVALDHLLHLRSVSGAAARMNMTQSAMSNALLRLREYFDDDLLVKIGRRLELTPRGESRKDAVRDVLVRVEWTIATTSEFDPGRSDRQFTILVSDYTLATLIPRLLAACQKARKRCVSISSTRSTRRNGCLNGAMSICSSSRANSRSRRHPLEVVLEEEFCAIVWSRGRLAGSKLSRRAFSEASHVVMQPPGGAQSLELVFFKQQEIARRVDVTTYSFSTMPLLVAGTDRIATVHRRLAQQAQQAMPIEILDLPFRIPKMRQAVQWHKYRSQDAGLIWLRGALREAAAQNNGRRCAVLAGPLRADTRRFRGGSCTSAIPHVPAVRPTVAIRPKASKAGATRRG